ncbi:holo-ACP synthase [Thiohalomonas denitrificans]|uniref:holo-ACP synthase n=1 Tax=Thiohalomonas denitrificans TaxID=415747 RepID=UPI0026F2D492|nr:holo-ACP synthase [Thiohalomonas denitrificans]
MIIGIGTDIVDVERIRVSMERHGERFAGRILDERELEIYRRAGNPAAFLAKRFAAKEAAAKAFGTGFRNGLSLRQIGISNNELGRPELTFSGRARELLAEQGVTHTFISLSDGREQAIAFVTFARQ